MIGLARLPVMGTTGGAVAPAAAGPWKCAAVAGPVKIVDCLLEPKLLGVACRALGKHRQGGWDVIGCPVMPGAGRRVGDHRREG